MPVPRFYFRYRKTDPSIKRLRWIMVGVMLFDLLITLASQPLTYWVDPTAVVESNPVVRVVMLQGILPLLLVSLVYSAVVVALVSILPRRLGLGVLLLVTMGHFYGASTWLQFRYHYDHGSLVYGFILTALLIASGLDTRQAPAASQKKHFHFASSVFAVAVVIISICSAPFILRASKLHRDATAYIQQAVPAIVRNWGTQELMSRTTPEALGVTSREEIDGFVALCQQLGSLKQLGKPLPNGDSISFIWLAARDGVSYTVRAEFEKGRAVIHLHLRELDDTWKIDRFRISSTFFSAQVPSTGTKLGTRIPVLQP